MLKKKQQSTTILLHGSNQLLGDKVDFSVREAYNLLRTNVVFSIPDKEGCKIIASTSPCPQEGKSYTSINLAYSLAKDGSKVLLIDADLRRPSVCISLDLPMEPGLTNMIAGEAGDFIHRNVLIEHLDVLTSGKIPPNPAELLGSSKMSEIIEKYSKEYDYLFFDFPPINSVADPLILSKYYDGMLLVVRHNSSRKSEIMEAVNQLQFAKVHILGFVYNGYSEHHSGYYKKGYYKQHYYHRDYSSVASSNDENKKNIDINATSK